MLCELWDWEQWDQVAKWYTTQHIVSGMISYTYTCKILLTPSSSDIVW